MACAYGRSGMGAPVVFSSGKEPFELITAWRPQYSRRSQLRLSSIVCHRAECPYFLRRLSATPGYFIVFGEKYAQAARRGWLSARHLEIPAVGSFFTFRENGSDNISLTPSTRQALSGKPQHPIRDSGLHLAAATELSIMIVMSPYREYGESSHRAQSRPFPACTRRVGSV